MVLCLYMSPVSPVLYTEVTVSNLLQTEHHKDGSFDNISLVIPNNKTLEH